jgi:PiT family inorganic phosphate transporter
MENQFWLLVLIVGVALVFDFMNGFHDAANSIATVVSTRVLRPQWAIAFLFFGSHVATTIGKGMVNASVIDPFVILAALVGAITWNVITWYYGIPASSSHALIGGLGGAAVAKAGFHALITNGFYKVGLSIVISPLIGFLFALILMIFISNLFFKSTPRRVDRLGRRLQLVSASLYSLGHGGNDAQKTMGIITILLVSAGAIGPEFKVPLWVILACQTAMGLGTLFGGWRIVRTMGMKITKLKPIGGFCAETGGAITVFLATSLGIPISTTHTITGAIMGVGSVTKFSAVRWGVAKNIVWAWVITIPASALVSALCWWMIQFIARK